MLMFVLINICVQFSRTIIGLNCWVAIRATKFQMNRSVDGACWCGYCCLSLHCIVESSLTHPYQITACISICHRCMHFDDKYSESDGPGFSLATSEFLDSNEPEMEFLMIFHWTARVNDITYWVRGFTPYFRMFCHVSKFVYFITNFPFLFLHLIKWIACVWAHNDESWYSVDASPFFLAFLIRWCSFFA